MKVVLFLLAVASATSAGPVVTWTKAVNWPEVRKIVVEISEVVFSSIDYVAAEAKRGDAEIGAEIEAYLATKRPEAEALTKQVLAEVDAQTLTLEKAEYYFLRLDTWGKELRNDLSDSVAQLPPINAQNISKRLDEDFALVYKLAEKIFELLQQ